MIPELGSNNAQEKDAHGAVCGGEKPQALSLDGRKRTRVQREGISGHEDC